MFLTDLPRALVRLWYVTLVGLLLTAGLTYATMQRVRPAYTAMGEVLLLPPSPTVPQGGNPYLYLGGLEVASDILAKVMSDDETAKQLQAKGVSSDFTVAVDQAAAAPMLLVTTTDTDPAAALSSLGLVLDRIPTSLAAVQRLAKTPSNAFIRTTVVTETSVPTLSLKPTLRAAGIAAAGGVGFMLVLVALVDSVTRRRAIRELGAEPEAPAIPRPSGRHETPRGGRATGRQRLQPTENETLGTGSRATTGVGHARTPDSADYGLGSTSWAVLESPTGPSRGQRVLSPEDPPELGRAALDDPDFDPDSENSWLSGTNR